MSEIEKIKRYIERTGVTYKDTSPYHINIREAFSLVHMDDATSAVALAFEYGRAKGYRAAQAERRAARG